MSEKMTIHEFAKMLDGRQYGYELTGAEQEQARRLGYLVVYGASDDLCEVHGAVDEEFNCYNGRQIVSKKIPKPITAVWCDKERDCAWSYKTDMPYAEFSIYEDDEIYCIGLVIDLETSKKTTLKPCPFCGNKKIEKRNGAIGGLQMFCCRNCGAAVSFHRAEYDPQATVHWNRRVNK